MICFKKKHNVKDRTNEQTVLVHNNDHRGDNIKSENKYDSKAM